MRKFAGFWSDVWHEINNLDDKSAKEKFEHIKQLIDIGDYVPPASSSPIGAAITRLHENGETNAALNLIVGYIVEHRAANWHILQKVQQPPGAFAIAAQSAFQALLATEFINSSIAADADIRTRLEASGKILEETSTLLDEIENNNARILVEVDDAREKGISRYRNQFLSSTQRVRKNLANLRRVLKTKNEKFDDLETTYNAHLRLKRPVELWMEREKEHWRQSRIAWGIFLVASVIFAAAITAFLYWGSDWLAESFVLKTCSGYPEEWCTGISPKGPFIVSAIFLLSTIVVWFLRLQIRIYLSERHLALDAAERGAFAETYLALLKGGDVSADQESVVLESLFRPTQDGIIKDDGASDIGIHGIAAKILEGRAK